MPATSISAVSCALCWAAGWSGGSIPTIVRRWMGSFRTFAFETQYATSTCNSREKEIRMKLSFRWYGEDDPIPLSYIRQIPGMYSIVSAVYDVPPGEVWLEESLARRKAQ